MDRQKNRNAKVRRATAESDGSSSNAPKRFRTVMNAMA